MKNFLWILIFVLLGAGCLPRTALHYYIHAADGHVTEVKYYPIYVDKEFGNADKVAIASAVEQWNFALNGQVKLAVIDWDFMMEPSVLKENAWYILKVDHNCKFKPMDTKTDITLAWANKLGGNYIYMIRDRMGNDDVRGIMMHELGHLLGTDHVGKYLMYYRYDRARYNCVDYASVESVGKSLKLDVSNLNYCIYESGI
jgi:hypothetical protein